jgi:hypothetical protein
MTRLQLKSNFQNFKICKTEDDLNDLAKFV